MAILRPTWVLQNTGRIGARDPGFMNFPRKHKDIFTVPKGWVLVDTDSGQIEPRVIVSAFIKDPVLKKCIMAYNDAYYGYIHYCLYLSDAERSNPNCEIIPRVIDDDMKSMRSRFKTYGNATMYGSTENKMQDPYKAKFIQYIGNHPARLEWQQRSLAAVTKGDYVVKTIFGTPIDVRNEGSASDRRYEDKSSDLYIKHLGKAALNNVVQGTAADLMRLSVLNAFSILREKSQYSCILGYIHDAGRFAIYEDDYPIVGKEIEDITAYQVDDWIPIYADAHVGPYEHKPLG